MREGQCLIKQFEFEIAHLFVFAAFFLELQVLTLALQVSEVLLLRLENEVAHEELDYVVAVLGLVTGLVQSDALGQVLFEVFGHLANLVAQNGVPIIFDGVVGSAENDIGDLGPAVLSIPLEHAQNPAFFNAPACLLQERTQLVVPTLSTLFARAVADLESDLLPLARANVRDKLDQDSVLFAIPCSFL